MLENKIFLKEILLHVISSLRYYGRGMQTLYIVEVLISSDCNFGEKLLIDLKSYPINHLKGKEIVYQ